MDAIPLRAMPSFLKAVVLLLVAVTGCQASSETTTTSTATTTSVTTAAEGSTGSRVYEMLALRTHPNGTQLRVDRVEVLSDSVVVSGSVTNGSSFGISIDRGATRLAADDGEISQLIEGLPDAPIPPGGELAIALRFGILTDPSSVTLILNSGDGSSKADPSTSAPTIELGPIALDSEISRPPLPDPIPVRRSVASPTGVELQIEGINFTENRIGVWVRIANPGQTNVSIAPSIAPSLLVDDLGNRYPLVLPEREGSMVIPGRSARSGVLSFAGRIHPDAANLNLGINAGAAGDTGDENTIYPRLIAEAIDLAGDSAVVPLPNPIIVSSVAEHPSGLRLELAAMAFQSDSSTAELVVSNFTSGLVALAALPTYLEDDRNNRYPLVAPTGNPQLTLESGTSLEGAFAFSGRVADIASQMTLVLNSGGSSDDPASPNPAFRLGPFELTRPNAAQLVEPKVFAVGTRSRLVDDVLASSEVEQITQTLTQFGATEIEGGFRLILPDNVLFDFNSTDLRPDAALALSLIADVLRYFEGEQVIVIGHTDSIGSSSYNQRLSEQRAESVVDTLANANGIPRDRLTAQGRGADEPIAPNSTPEGQDNPEGRQLNRRVEIVVLTDRDLPVP